MTGIDIGEVIGIGDATGRVGDRFARVAEGMRGWRRIGPDEMPFSMGVSMADAGTTWQAGLAGLAHDVRNIGESLRAAAEDYRRADEAARDRLR